MISPGVREPDGAVTLAGAGAAAGSAGRGRGTIAGAGVLSVASTGFVAGTSTSFAGFVGTSASFTGFAGTNASLNMGAGCEPDCMNRTLERMAIVANAPIAKPAISLGPHPGARNGCGPRSSSWTLFPRPARAVELRTCLHPCLGGDADQCAGGAAQRNPRAGAITEPSGRNHVYMHARCLGRAPLIRWHNGVRGRLSEH